MNLHSAEITSVSRSLRSKRKQAGTDLSLRPDSEAIDNHETNRATVFKRQKRSIKHSSAENSEEKENFHRSRALAPRARSARVLVDLVIDLPTDCSDFEVSEGDEEKFDSGSLFRMRELRINDPANAFYNFKIHEDA